MSGDLGWLASVINVMYGEEGICIGSMKWTWGEDDDRGSRSEERSGDGMCDLLPPDD